MSHAVEGCRRSKAHGTIVTHAPSVNGNDVTVSILFKLGGCPSVVVILLAEEVVNRRADRGILQSKALL